MDWVCLQGRAEDSAIRGGVDELGLHFQPGIPSLMGYVMRCEGIDAGSQES